MSGALVFTFFFFNDTATTEIYTLSLHDALPILAKTGVNRSGLLNSGLSEGSSRASSVPGAMVDPTDRKSTRLNSSHGYISYAVFCLKKKKKQQSQTFRTIRVNGQLGSHQAPCDT